MADLDYFRTAQFLQCEVFDLFRSALYVHPVYCERWHTQLIGKGYLHVGPFRVDQTKQIFGSQRKWYRFTLVTDAVALPESAQGRKQCIPFQFLICRSSSLAGG